MNISVIHPSRGRPEQALATCNKWLERANNEIDYILIVDADDHKRDEYFDLFTGEVRFIRDNNKSAIEAINRGARQATGNLLIVVSDDFDCPQHWDTLLLEALKDKEDFCVKTQDGFQKVLMTLPILDRAYYNRFGYIYNPIYQHMYADQEMTAVAHMVGRDITLDLQFTHYHYLNRKRGKDAVDNKNLLTMQSGKEIYNRRVRQNFGLKDSDIVKPYSQIVWR